MPKKSDALIKVENEIADVKKYMAEMAKKKDGIPGGSLAAICERVEKIEQALQTLGQDQESRLMKALDTLKVKYHIEDAPPPTPEPQAKKAKPEQITLIPEELYI